MLFNIFINDKDIKIVCTLNKFADDTTISIAVDTSEEHDGSGKYLKIESKRISWNSINPRVTYGGAIPDMSRDKEKHLREALRRRTWGFL